MIYLLLSIASSSILFVIFKLFDRFEINTFQAIVTNYFVAATMGLLSYKNPINIIEITHLQWFYFTIFLGVLFIIVFNLMAVTTQKNGLSVVAVATKMSFIIPVIFGLIFYQESLGILKLLGMILAVIAVYLVSVKERQESLSHYKTLWLPILVFIGSGVIDTCIKFIESTYLIESDIVLFLSVVFGTAGILGISTILIQKIKGTLSFNFKNILAGIILGIPNFFSMYFLVLALRSSFFESSGIFTTNNVGIVVVSTIIGYIIFKEKISKKNGIGIFISISSILLMALHQFLHAQ